MDPGRIGEDGKPFQGLVDVESIDRFELRKLSGGAIAIAVKSDYGADIRQNVYSQQKYSFQLSGSTRLSAVSDTEWLAAPALDRTRNRAVTEGLVDPRRSQDFFNYSGHRFQGSGKFLTDPGVAGVQSPEGAWLAVQSVDKLEGGSGNPLIAFRSMYYFDIFNIATGLKQSTVRLYVDPAATVACWISSNYLFIDALEAKKRDFILCDASQQGK